MRPLPRFARSLKRRGLDEHGPDRLYGGGKDGFGDEDRLLGGLLAAQDIRFEVRRPRNGKNFRSRIVEAWQVPGLLLELTLLPFYTLHRRRGS